VNINPKEFATWDNALTGKRYQVSPGMLILMVDIGPGIIGARDASTGTGAEDYPPTPFAAQVIGVHCHYPSSAGPRWGSGSARIAFYHAEDSVSQLVQLEILGCYAVPLLTRTIIVRADR
jgi:hypothetical protein